MSTDWLVGDLVAELEQLRAEIERLTGILKEVHATCYIPSKSRHAYTHFQADFDKIRKLTGEAIDMTGKT